MAKVKIPCLVGKTNKAGITSWYWQPSKTLAEAGWTGIPLGKNMAAAVTAAQERNRLVDKWREGDFSPKNVSRHNNTGTVGALIARYRREIMDGTDASGNPKLKPRTREGYETHLKRLDAWAGKHPLEYVTKLRVKKLKEAIAKPVDQGGLGHSPAFALLKMGRQVFAFAEACDLIPPGANPFREFGMTGPASRRLIWSAEDEAAFVAAAYELGLPSMALAIELALYTAQREGDLIAFTEPQLQDLEIYDTRLRDMLAGEDGKVKGWVMDQAKLTNHDQARSMEIPIEPKLAAKVQAAIRNNRARDRAMDPPILVTHVLVNDRSGNPWKKRHFIKTWTQIRDHAAERTNRPQMKKLVWHDLRRTRVVRLRRRGMPKEMISAITGHDPKSIDEMLKVYGPIDPTITAAALASTLDAGAA